MTSSHVDKYVLYKRKYTQTEVQAYGKPYCQQNSIFAYNINIRTYVHLQFLMSPVTACIQFELQFYT